MLDRLIQFFKGPYLFDPHVWKGRLRPTTFRPLTPADIPQCVEIYELNEPGRFPGDGRGPYQACLEAGKAWYIVAEGDNRIVATGGIARSARDDVVVLSYGLVHPMHQGRGLGIALTLARIAMLDPTRPVHYVVIFAVKKAIGYYRRLGFVVFTSWKFKDKPGPYHPAAVLRVFDHEIVRCRELLKQHEIIWPDPGGQMPRDEPGTYPEWLAALLLPPQTDTR